MRVLPTQEAVCQRYSVNAAIPLHHDKLGIALRTLEMQPINGLRIPAMSGSSGWFIYGGKEPGLEANFYSPLRVRNLSKHCEIAVPYICLPAGWRFQVDADGYEDVWFDERLLRRDVSQEPDDS